MIARVWILGAADPEMDAIEALLRECGERVVYAVDERGERVRPAAMYRARLASPVTADVIYEVECMVTDRSAPVTGQRIMIDHHRPGDPGYGRPPAEFMSASSIGQVIAELARIGRLPATWRRLYPSRVAGPGYMTAAPDGDRDGCLSWCVATPWRGLDVWLTRIPHDHVLLAAADHCLGAAYRGECPGVDPGALMRWRAESRATFQGRPVEEILSDVERTMAALRAAPEVALDTWTCPWHTAGGSPHDDCLTERGTEYADEPCGAVIVRDMRIVLAGRCPDCHGYRELHGQESAGDEACSCRLVHTELTEAATRLGIGYISGPIEQPDGRRKFTCSGTSEQVRAFIDVWAPREGLVDLYGDPARGFAGGYAQEGRGDDNV